MKEVQAQLTREDELVNFRLDTWKEMKIFIAKERDKYLKESKNECR